MTAFALLALLVAASDAPQTPPQPPPPQPAPTQPAPAPEQKRPLVERVPLPGLILLAAGGIAYTAGVVFYALDSRLRYFHAIWHGFVAAGSGCHFFAVLNYAA